MLREWLSGLFARILGNGELTVIKETGRQDGYERAAAYAEGVLEGAHDALSTASERFREEAIVFEQATVEAALEPPVETPVDEPVDYGTLKKAELLALCDDRGVQASTRLTKAKLVALLEA